MTPFQHIHDVFPKLGSVFILLIRGVPGAGKTSLAEEVTIRLLDEPIVVAGDDFFTSPHGTYKFSMAHIAKAHQLANTKMDYAMYHGLPLIVHNTATRLWEMDHVKSLAVEYKVPLLVVDLKTQYGNVHGVPADKVKQMQDRFDSVLDIEIVGLNRTEVTMMDEFDSVLFVPDAV